MKKLLLFLLTIVTLGYFAAPLSAQNTQTFDFEDNAIPADWTNDATHPWVVTNSSQGNGHNGTYCIKSGNSGIGSSTSTLSATFTFAGEGSISFLAGIWGEGTSWDVCTFSIDGVEQFSEGNTDTWTTRSYDLEAGTHTFTWSYSKDGSVNPTGDAFFLDDIVVDLGVASSCARPASITLGTISDNSIDITWTPLGEETAWIVSLYDSNGDLLPGYPDDATTTEYSFTGLEANTSYTIGVKANCGSELSAERIINAHTACVANTEFPWSDNFESYPASSDGTTFSNPCWINEHISGGGSSLFQIYSGTMSDNATNKLRLPDMTSGTKTKLVLPLMDIPEGTNYLFSLDVLRNASGTSSTSEGVRVYASTNGDIEGATELGFLYRNCGQTDSNVVMAETSTGWYNYEFPIPFSGNCYIILRGESQYGSSTYMDNFMIMEAPTCMAVTALTADTITSNSITLSWNDNSNTDATYTIYNMADTSEVTDVTFDGTTAVISGLNPNTAYTFGVSADCGSDDYSSIRSIKVRTACGAMSLPWTCGFEANEIVSTTQATALPWCTSRLSVPSNVSYPNYPYAYNYSDYSHNGNYSLYFYSSGSSYPDTMNFILPEIDVDAFPMDGNRLTFWARSSSSSYNKVVYVGTLSDPTDLSTFTFVNSVTVSGTTYTKYSIPLATETSSETSTAPYVCIRVLKSDGSLFIDDMTLEEMPSCLEVANAAIIDSLTTTTSITITWIDTLNPEGTTYTIYNMADNSVVATATDTIATIEELVANTLYTFGVQANCGDDGAPITTVSGRTACAPFAAPYTWTFEDMTASADPVCWSKVGSGTVNVISSTDYSHNSSKCIRFSGSLSNLIVLPETEEGIGTLQLRFWTRPESFDYNYSGTFSVGYVTDAGSASSFVEVAQYVYSDFTSITEKTVTFAGAPEGARMAMRHNSNLTNWYWFVDDVTIEAAPDCLPVSALTANNIGSYSATLTWLGNADNYVVYDMSDTTEAANATVDGTTAVITDLDPDSTYTFGVAADCGSDGESAIVSVTFTTLVSCPAPSNVTATLTPGNGTVATLTWHELGAADAWQICLNGDTNNLIDATDTLYEFTDLTPEQVYTVQVRAICSADEHSAWCNTVTFQPTTKTVIGSGTATNSYLPTYTYYNYSLTQQIYTAEELGETPNVIFSVDYYCSGSVNRNVNIYMVSTAKTSFANSSDWIPVTDSNLVYSGPVNFASNAWTTITLDNPFLYDGESNVAIIFDDNTGSYVSSPDFRVFDANSKAIRIYSDDVNYNPYAPTSYSGTVLNVKNQIRLVLGEIPSCWPVTGLTVIANSITAEGATLTWSGDADSYNVYAINGTDTTLDQNVSETTAILTGLTATTSYTYGVRAVCNGEESDIRTVVFSTACNAVALPFTETFETTSATLQCWTSEGDDEWVLGVGDYSTSTGSFQGSRNALITHSDDGNVTKLISPVLDGVETGLVLDFAYVMRVWSGDIDEFRVYSRSAADSSWQQVAEFTTTTTWTVSSVIIPGTVYQVAFEFTDGYGYGLGLDSVVFTAISDDYCYPVTNLTVDSTTTTSISLSWTDNSNTGITYTVYNGSDVVATNIATTSYVVTDLAPSSIYSLGVVANCSATSESNMVTVYAMTDCGIVTALPYTESFDNIASDNVSAFPQCWQRPVQYSGYPYAVTAYQHSAPASLRFQSLTTKPTTAATPQFAEDIHNLKLNFWLKAESTTYSGTFEVGVMSDPSDTSTFVGVLTIQPSSTDWTEYTIDFDTMEVSGTNKAIGFRQHSNSSSWYYWLDDVTVSLNDTTGPVVTTYTVTLNTADATMGSVSPDTVATVNAGSSFTATATANAGYVFVAWMDGTTQVSTDNPYTFTVNANTTLTATFATEPTEPCDVPTGLHTTAIENHSVTIAWDANDNANSWNIRYRVVNGTWNTAPNVSTNSYTISGLEGSTDYEFQVQANCGNDNHSAWSASVTAHTTNVGIVSHLENSVTLFPNPAKEYIDVRIDGEFNVNTMEVYDVYGKLISNVNVIDNPTRINVSNLANGMYFVRVTTDAGVVTKTFVKK